MTALDCADPSMQVGRRNESVSPLQALAQLNNAFVLAMSRHFAARLESTEDSLPGRVRRGCLETLGRALPSEDETLLVAYAREHGLVNCCRLLLNLNEFAFVD
jgi:hypothetical protein